MHKFLFYNKLIICLYMFRAPCTHHQEVKIVLYSIWYRHTETSKWSKVTKIQQNIKKKGGGVCHEADYRELVSCTLQIITVNRTGYLN